MTTRSQRSLPIVEVLTSDASIQALGGEWDTLLTSASHASPFLSWAWISTWHETLGADHRPRVATARDPIDGRLVAALPLAVVESGRRYLRYRVLTFMGTAPPAAGDHADAVVRTNWDHVVPGLWKAATADRTWDVIDFQGLRPGSILAASMARRAEDRGRYTERIACPAIELPGEWESYEATLGRNLRQNLRRYGRKLEREAPGPVQTRMVTARHDVDPTMDALIRLHQRRWEDEDVPGAFADLQARSFHHQVARQFFDAGRLRLHRLDISGEAIAVIYCFRHGDTVAFYQSGRDPAWAKYGPGRHMMAHAIRAAIDEGATRFDMLRGAEPYKAGWNADDRFDERIRMPDGPKGRLLIAARTARRVVRRG